MTDTAKKTKASPKTAGVLAALKRQIAIGNYARGSALPSQYELAKEFHVTHITVRKAIAILTEEGLLRSVPRVGFFVRDSIPEKKNQRQIGLILPAYITQEYLDFMLHLNKICNERNLLLKQAFARYWDDRSINECLECCDGIIAWSLTPPEELTPAILEKIKSYRKPFVWVGDNMQKENLNSVAGDFNLEINMLIDYLQGMGHSRIGIVTQQFSDNRISHFYHPWHKRMSRILGSEAKTNELLINVKVPDYEYPNQAIYDALRKKKGKFPFTVLICHSSNYLTVISALAADGVSIPKDLSVAVIGDRNEMDFYLPHPTYVKVSLQKHAELSVRLISDCWKNPAKPAQCLHVQPQIIPGKSVKKIISNHSIKKEKEKNER